MLIQGIDTIDDPAFVVKVTIDRKYNFLLVKERATGGFHMDEEALSLHASALRFVAW